MSARTGQPLEGENGLTKSNSKDMNNTLKTCFRLAGATGVCAAISLSSGYVDEWETCPRSEWQTTKYIRENDQRNTPSDHDKSEEETSADQLAYKTVDLLIL